MNDIQMFAKDNPGLIPALILIVAAGLTALFTGIMLLINLIS